MIKNLSEYFLPEYQFFLNNISYKIIERNIPMEEYQLNCTDSVHVDLTGKGVRLIFTRLLKFNPENLFELNVSFGSILTFDESRKEEIQWNELNLGDEFLNNGEFVLSNLISRTSLQIAQITSSFGQAPVITPPQMIEKKK